MIVIIHFGGIFFCFHSTYKCCCSHLYLL